ncbi:hypothetical protein CR513_52248, partial [Mucuna pruriens]
MEYMKKLEEKIEKLGGGLDSMRIDSNNVNAKIRSWSKKQEKEVKKSKKVSSSSDEHGESYNSKSNRSHRSEKNELKVKQNLDCINCEDITNIKLIALSFEGYALIRGMGRACIESWEELKKEMSESFFPLYYKRDSFVELQNIYQGTRSVEKYFKEMEFTIIRAQIVESQEATMIRFLHGLNRYIQDIMELHDYTFISTIVHQASKVESQLKRYGRNSYPTTSSN